MLQSEKNSGMGKGPVDIKPVEDNDNLWDNFTDWAGRLGESVKAVPADLVQGIANQYVGGLFNAGGQIQSGSMETFRNYEVSPEVKQQGGGLNVEALTKKAISEKLGSKEDATAVGALMDPILVASEPVEIAWSHAIARPLSTYNILTDTNSPLAKNGFQLNDIVDAYNRSEKVSYGQSLGKSALFQYSPAGLIATNAMSRLGFDISKVDLWNDQSIKENYEDNLVGKIFSGSADVVLNVVGSIALDKGASALKDAAGLNTTIRGIRDLTKLEASAARHFEYTATGGASGERTTFGILAEELANSNNYELNALKVQRLSNNERLVALTTAVDDPNIVADMILADKGHLPALKRLLERDPDYLYELGDMQASMIGRNLDGITQPSDDMLANLNAAYDKALERNPYYRQVWDAFMDETGKPKLLGTSWKPAENLLMESVRGKALTLRAAVKSGDFSNLEGFAAQVLSGRAGAPVTILLKWTGSGMPRGILSATHSHMNENLDEIASIFDDLRMLRNNKKVLKTEQRLAALDSPNVLEYQTITVAEYRANMMKAFATSKNVDLPKLVDAFETELADLLSTNYGVPREVVENIVTKQRQSLIDEIGAVAQRGFVFDEVGNRLVFEAQFARQFVDAIPMLNWREIERGVRILATNSKFKKRSIKAQQYIVAGFNTGQRFFTSNMLLRPAYTPKNSILEPKLAEFLALGSIIPDAGLSKTATNWFVNRGNNIANLATKVKNLIPKSELKFISREIDKLSESYRAALLMRDNATAEYVKLASGELSPVITKERGNIIIRNLQKADELVQAMEQRFDAIAPGARSSAPVPSLFELKRRIDYLKNVKKPYETSVDLPSTISIDKKEITDLSLDAKEYAQSVLDFRDSDYVKQVMMDYLTDNPDWEYNLAVNLDIETAIKRSDFEDIVKYFYGQTQKSLNKRFPNSDYVEVWRKGRIDEFREVVSTTMRKGGLRSFQPSVKYYVKKSDVLFDTEGVIPRSNYAEEELLVSLHSLLTEEQFLKATKVTKMGGINTSALEWEFRNLVEKNMTWNELKKLDEVDQSIAKAIEAADIELKKLGEKATEQAKIFEKRLPYKRKRLSYEGDTVYTTSTGVQVKYKDLFADDQFGQAMRAEFSAGQTQQLTFANELHKAHAVSRHNRLTNPGVITPDDINYFEQLAYFANRYLRKDALGQQILEGVSQEDLIRWALTREGRQYAAEFNVTDVDQVPSFIATRFNAMYRYFPTEEVRKYVATNEVNSASLQKMLGNDLAKLSPINSSDFDEVVAMNNASIGDTFKSVTAATKALERKLFTMIATNPEDLVGRFPVAGKLFRENMNRRIETLAQQNVTVDDFNSIRQGAMRETLKQMEDIFYNIRRQNRFIFSTRILASFPQAMFSGIRRYTKFAINNPGRTMFALQSYRDIYESFGVDDQGNRVPIGEATHIIVPFSKEILSWLGHNSEKGILLPRGFGGIAINTIGASWLVSFSAQQLLQSKPNYEETLSNILGFNAYKWLFPQQYVPKNPIEVFIAGYQRDLLDYFNSNESNADFLQAWTQSHQYLMAEWEKNGRIGKEPTEDEAYNLGKSWFFNKFLTKFFVGFSAQIDAPGQVGRDVFYAELEKQNYDFDKTREILANKFGDYMNWYSFSTSQSTVNIPATQEAYNRVWVENVDLAKDLYEIDTENPEAVGLMVIDATGEFSSPVYNWLRSNPIPGEATANKHVLTPAKFKQLKGINEGWDAYFELRDQLDEATGGATRLTGALKEQWDFALRGIDPTGKFKKQYPDYVPVSKLHPEWHEAYKLGISENTGYKWASALNKVVNNKKFMKKYGKSQFWQTGINYIVNREVASRAIAQGYPASQVKAQWQAYIEQDFLSKAGDNYNKKFRDFYLRYLDNDTLEGFGN